MQEASFSFRLGAPQPSDPQSIFHLGQAFYLAGTRCATDVEVGPGMVQSLTSPAVVNFCFAIELFFKAIIQSEGKKPPKTHELEKLFAALPEETRNALEAAYARVVIDPDLAELLRQANDYFQQVRYEYEFNVFAYLDHPIRSLAKALYVYCADEFGYSPPLEAIQT